MAEITTGRLLLRQWCEEDLAPFAALNGNPEVMRYFPAPLTREQSDNLARFAQGQIAMHGWGLWAVEVRSGAPFIGFVGLNRPRFEAHFTPAIEVGWRLDRPYWGHGYATEAAAAALTFAFDELEYPEVVSFTSLINEPSLRVMRRLGMSHDPADDFDHPAVTDARLRRHALYRMRGELWSRQRPER
ncbi:MAG: GNAT family N-acetyltransferase [Solirubrobacteraceae bacterium]